MEPFASGSHWRDVFQQGLVYQLGQHNFPVALTGATTGEAPQTCACFRVPGQYLTAVTDLMVACHVAVGEWFDQGKWFGYQDNPGRQIKPQFSHKEASESSQTPLPAKLRGQRQLLQGSQQLSPYPGTDCASWGLHLLPQATARVGVLRALSLKIKWEFPVRRVEMLKAAAPSLWLVLAQPHRSASHGSNALLRPVSRPSLSLGCIFLWSAATSKLSSSSLLPQTGRYALGKLSVWLAAYEHALCCTFELIPPAFVCLADKTSQQCLEKRLMRDHCLHNKAMLPLQPSLSIIYIPANLWKRVKYVAKVCFYVV